jgi:predicted RNase H-like nuclease (RuvC/YqgF family)
MEKAADRIEALTAKVKLMDDLDVINGEKIETLTEQLEAARADAKEAEAYAEELEREIELNEQEACMLENDLIKADKEIDDLKATLAEIEGTNAP